MTSIEVKYVIKKIKEFLNLKLYENILITGGGYIGTNLTQKLLEKL